jgi:protein-S-isoprenylcysteine O-methyltransferase Ste14
MLFTPIISLIIVLISWKEEQKLAKEFGRLYIDYKKPVPMLIPRLHGLHDRKAPA